VGHGDVAQLSRCRRSTPVEQHTREAASQTLAPSTAMAAGDCTRRPKPHVARPDDAGSALRGRRPALRGLSGLRDAAYVWAKRSGYICEGHGEEECVAAGDQAGSGPGHKAVDVGWRAAGAARQLIVATHGQPHAVVIRASHRDARRNRSWVRRRNHHPRPNYRRALRQQEALLRRRRRAGTATARSAATRQTGSKPAGAVRRRITVRSFAHSPAALSTPQQERDARDGRGEALRNRPIGGRAALASVDDWSSGLPGVKLLGGLGRPARRCVAERVGTTVSSPYAGRPWPS
jgi:hypothetical protein